MSGDRSSSRRREKISEIHKAMDFKTEGNFAEAWDWLDLNLDWINAVLLNGELVVKQGYFSVQEKNCEIASHGTMKLTHDEWISASKSLITLFKEYTSLFAQLACLKANWELGNFMENDVIYLRDYLKAYSISIQDPTFYLLFKTNSTHSSSVFPVIDNVYNLCYYLGSFGSVYHTDVCVSEDFLLPVLLFMKLMSKAGFFQDSFLHFRIQGKNCRSKIEEGIMLVFGDGDVDSAIDCLISNYFFGPKQGIWLMKKALVQETVYDYFISGLLKQINKIAFLSAHYDEELQELDKLISDAKSVGIEVYETKLLKTGLKGPIIFKGEPPSCVDLNQTELRLPFITAQPFRTTEECITLANNNIHCSNASLWTESHSLATKAHHLLRMNTTWLNAHGLIDPLVPIYCPTIEKYFSIKWDIYCASISSLPPGYRHPEITGDEFSNSQNHIIQKAEKAQKDWQKVDLLQRAKILSDIAYNFRERITSDEAQHAADIFFYFAEECHRCTHSTSIVTNKGLYQISFEPRGLVRTSFGPDLNNFEGLALLTAPLICYGNSVIISFNDEDESKYLEFQSIMLSSGLPENLINVVNTDFNRLIKVDIIYRKLRELLIAGEYNRKTFNFVLRTLSYHASLPKVLWTQN